LMPQNFKATVRDLSHKGLGVIDHPDGRTFFVRGSWPGDEGEFEISDDAQKYEEARLLRLLRPSKDRIEIQCSYRGFNPGQCGGCPWMMANYDSQLFYKVKRLIHALAKRRVHLSENVLRDVIPSPMTMGYRNRVQLKTNGDKLGYVSEGSSTFAPVENCLIMNKSLDELFHEVLRSLPRDDFRPTGNHKWSYLDLDDEMNVQEIILNKRRPFRQGNTEQNLRMRKWVMEKFLPLPRHFPVVDLFCGSGNFTQVLSELGFSNILAVEVQGSALEVLRGKNLPGVRVLSLDINQKGSWALIARHQPHARAILIDPPREGMEKRRGLFKYLDNLEKIFYVSCELDTFARDVADILNNYWSIDELTPIDLFPHTPHIEIMSVFSKVKPPNNCIVSGQ
jgi:23S rRNA (uracil1939-C5)-methyltransferase